MDFKINSAKKIILYKLLRNILITLSVIWVGVLISDSILVGFISSQISFLKLTLITTALLSLIYLLTKDFELKEIKTESKNIYFIGFLFIIATLILVLGALDFNLFSLITIIITTLLVLFYFYKEFINHKS